MGAQWKTAGKVANAAARGKIISKISKEIMIAAKAGADPAHNARLRIAIESAKKHSVPRDNIERAIKKGAGLLDEVVHYEHVTYEGFAPHRVAVVVECLTDNNKRTATNIRYLFRAGQLGTSGSVTWDFAHLGFIEATPPEGGADPEEAAIEAGAQDFEPAGGEGGDGGVLFYTEPHDVDAVAKALTGRGWTVASMRLGWRAKNPVQLEDAAARAEVEAFLHELDQDDDVQHVYAALDA